MASSEILLIVAGAGVLALYEYDEGYKSWMHCVSSKTPFETQWLMLQQGGEYRWQHVLADPSFRLLAIRRS
jgi:hypothetical protein